MVPREVRTVRPDFNPDGALDDSGYRSTLGRPPERESESRSVLNHRPRAVLAGRLVTSELDISRLHLCAWIILVLRPALILYFLHRHSFGEPFPFHNKIRSSRFCWWHKLQINAECFKPKILAHVFIQTFKWVGGVNRCLNWPWIPFFLEQSLQRSGNLDKSVFSTPDKMEALQNTRAQRWGNQMDKHACYISTLDRHVGVKQHTCFISCCA